MSIQPDALDRSVLESKKLDELQAIASAIGAKAGSRARKAQVVDAILAAAGVDESSAPAAEASSTGPTSGSSVAERSTSDAGDGSNAAPPDRGKRSRPSFSADPWADAADEQEKFRQKTERQRTGGRATEGQTADGESANGSGPADEQGSLDLGADESPAADRQGRSTGSDSDDASTRSDNSKNGRSTDGQSKREDSADGQSTSPQSTDDRSDGGQNRDGGKGDAGQNRDGGKGDAGQNRDGGKGQGGQNRDGGKGQGGQNRDGGQNSDRNNNEQPEPGNRRRRRRGRDRDREDTEPQGDPVEVSGLLDLRDEGYGFLRTKGYLPSRDDVYVSAKQVRQYSLRKGDLLTGMSRPATRNEKNPGLLRVDTVNDLSPDDAVKRPKFEDLTPLFPDEKLQLERPDDPGDMTARIIDLIAPIGKGQRGLIVSPPKAGKTTIMKTIATAIEANNPDVHLMVLLVDERPEEVTDMRRTVRGEVVSSTFDRPSDEHTQVAELSIERAKRLAETGKDVVIILDGITRLARAYNLAAPATGRIMSGGVDSGALYPPKRFFGAARNLEEGGSLTILATALIETGSRMDEVIFEEFKGTGNMELRLDRRLAERRIYPAIDVDASSTRQEQLLFERRQYPQVMKLRRVLSGLAGGGDEGRPGAGLELMVDRLKTFNSNDEFLAEIARAPSGV